MKVLLKYNCTVLILLVCNISVSSQFYRNIYLEGSFGYGGVYNRGELIQTSSNGTDESTIYNIKKEIVTSSSGYNFSIGYTLFKGHSLEFKRGLINYKQKLETEIVMQIGFGESIVSPQILLQNNETSFYGIYYVFNHDFRNYSLEVWAGYNREKVLDVSALEAQTYCGTYPKSYSQSFGTGIQRRLTNKLDIGMSVTMTRMIKKYFFEPPQYCSIDGQFYPAHIGLELTLRYTPWKR